MAAKPTDPSELLYQGQNVLGKATQVETPGQVSQPLTAGIASTPAAGGVTTDAGGAVDRSGGLSGAVGGAASGSGGGEDGQSLEALIAQILGTAAKTADFAGKLTQPETPGTRGGGSGTLSDQLRSQLGSSGGTVAGAGLGLGGIPFQATNIGNFVNSGTNALTGVPFTSLTDYSPEAINRFLESV